MDIKSELYEYMLEVQQFSKDMSQDGNALSEYAIRLTNIMARANYLMAEYNRQYREAKKIAYSDLKRQYENAKTKLSPSLAKDFVDAQCSEPAYCYELAERTSRLCTHTLDAVKMASMALMNERKFLTNQ